MDLKQIKNVFQIFLDNISLGLTGRWSLFDINEESKMVSD